MVHFVFLAEVDEFSFVIQDFKSIFHGQDLNLGDQFHNLQHLCCVWTDEE